MASQITFDVLARDRASKTFDNVGRSASRNADRVGGSFGRMGKFIGAAAVSGVAAVGAMGIAGAVMGVKVAAGNEQAQIAFETMLGSAKKASAFLKDLQAFAAKTPFEFPELQTAASSLISAGIEAKKVIPIMTTLGDVTSGMGTGSEGVKRATIALQQMNAAGRITGEDLNQLRDAGIPVYDLLAKATGKSKAEVVKLAQAGKLGKKELDQMMKALESGKGLERFTGLMSKQATSLTGLWSTFKDTLGQGLAKAITPLIPLMKKGLGGASEGLAKALGWVGETIPKVIAVGQRFHKFFAGQMMPALKSAWKTILPGVRDAMRILSGQVGSGSVSWKKIGDTITQKVIPTLAQIARVWLPIVAAILRNAITQWKLFAKVIGGIWSIARPVFTALTRAFLNVVGTLISGAARAFGWVPGIGPKLQRAAAEFDKFKRQANAALNGVKNKRVYVSAPGASATIQKLADLRWQIDRIPRSVTIGVNNKLAGMRAAGGPVTAGKTYLVGEKGPEFITPSKSGYVHPNGSGMGGGGPQVIQLLLDGQVIETVLLARKRRRGNLALGL